jgi:hypothetical protein
MFEGHPLAVTAQLEASQVEPAPQRCFLRSHTHPLLRATSNQPASSPPSLSQRPKLQIWPLNEALFLGMQHPNFPLGSRPSPPRTATVYIGRFEDGFMCVIRRSHRT